MRISYARCRIIGLATGSRPRADERCGPSSPECLPGKRFLEHANENPVEGADRTYATPPTDRRHLPRTGRIGERASRCFTASAGVGTLRERYAALRLFSR